MPTALYIPLILVALFIIYFLVRLIWFRPLGINLFYLRTFLEIGLDSPELLTMVGLLEKFGLDFHNSKLADASQKHEDKLYAHLHRYQAQLHGYKRDRLSKAGQLSYDILDHFLTDQVSLEPFRHHDYPLNQMFGIQSDLPNFMLTIHPLKTARDARNYIQRLLKFGLKFEQVMEGLEVRERKSIIPPRFVIRRVLDEMIAFIGQPATQNPLYSVFAEKVIKMGLLEPERDGLLKHAESAILSTVYPAYQRFITYFNSLEQKATDDDGVWKLPDGDAYYASQLRSNTTTKFTPAEVHDIGLLEVSRIEGEMSAILANLGYASTNISKQMLAFANEDRFHFPNSDLGRTECLAEFQRILDDINQNLAPFFNMRPKAGLKVERIPEFREKTSAGAYYQPSSLGGARPGVFYANLRDMSEVAKFGMQTLAYHEGIPGHHFQIAIAQELKGVPFFRRLLPFTAYAEGWALYAEKLAREVGFLADPYAVLGYLSSELFRAVRLVVDTGIHYKHWTRQQAIDYMIAHTGTPLESIVSEVERYIVMPGQACAYKLGEIKIVQLRQKAKDALGERFDIRQFHDVVLKNGSVPLALLERIIDDFIAVN
jgi:uncharacterized protein (DUF885 family)